MTKIPSPSIASLFPPGSKILLTGTGRQFIERIGIEAAREVVAGVLTGKNIRDQTEPLTRRRVAQVTGGVVALFAHGMAVIPDFKTQLSKLALAQLQSKLGKNKAEIWPAQWLIGLTDKGYQNILSGDSAKRNAYIAGFELAIADAAAKCKNDLGDLRLALGFVTTPAGKMVELDWAGIARLTTAIGCATLAIRGSDKSLYGKLFERLVLGSVLSILGFRLAKTGDKPGNSKVFWLSDSSDTRESDATAIYKPGKLARFDIGFIGPGNSEISKDKLSRFAQVAVRDKVEHSSKTFIVVDRLPPTGKTHAAAKLINAEIVQMSMKYWPRELAQHLGCWFETKFELANIEDSKVEAYLRSQLKTVPLQNFLADGVVNGADESDNETEVE